MGIGGRKERNKEASGCVFGGASRVGLWGSRGLPAVVCEVALRGGIVIVDADVGVVDGAVVVAEGVLVVVGSGAVALSAE